ncbi:MAG: carbohydrate ABC transporter permease [Thermoanaerobaculia bacterium]
MKKALAALFVNAALVFGAVLALTPLVWMIAASLMRPGEASEFPPPFLPSRPTLENYWDLFTRLALGRNLANSLLVAGATTLGVLFLNSMAGYAFAKLRFPGRDRLFGALVGALVIPAQVSMLPLFLMLRSLGLVNTYAGAVLPGLAGIIGIFLIRQFARSIPDDLIDAARLEGAGEFRIYWQIVLPLLRPVLATLGIVTFLATWNDFVWPLVILTDESRYTLPVALASLVGEHVPDTELMMAGAVLTVLPVLLLFLLLQRQYVEGITLGGVKE